MKTKIFACVTITVIIAFVTINTIYLDSAITELTDLVAALNLDDENALQNANDVFENFKDAEAYISITVSHDDLTNIEDGFAELVGYLRVEDTEGAKVVKNRLINSLEHLRRLSGFNFDSII